MVRIPIQGSPTHPGEVLLEEFQKPMGISQRGLAEAIHAPHQRVNELVNRRRGITPSTALRLARFFGMTPAAPPLPGRREPHPPPASRSAARIGSGRR